MKLHKGKLIKQVQEYPIGTIFDYHINKLRDDYGKWTGEFDYYGLFKSDKTESGKHSLLIFRNDFEEIVGKMF